MKRDSGPQKGRLTASPSTRTAIGSLLGILIRRLSKSTTPTNCSSCLPPRPQMLVAGRFPRLLGPPTAQGFMPASGSRSSLLRIGRLYVPSSTRRLTLDVASRVTRDGPGSASYREDGRPCWRGPLCREIDALVTRRFRWSPLHATRQPEAPRDLRHREMGGERQTQEHQESKICQPL